MKPKPRIYAVRAWDGIRWVCDVGKLSGYASASPRDAYYRMKQSLLQYRMWRHLGEAM